MMANTDNKTADLAPRSRLANWDLLRSLSMFAVVVVHSASYLGPIMGVSTRAIGTFAILCDPIFFTLSGYFAIRPLKGSLGQYYLKKISTIVLPLFLYSALLYGYETKLIGMSIPGYVEYFLNLLSPWWFIPALIPFLMIAPYLYHCFEGLSDKQFKTLIKLAFALIMWGVTCCLIVWGSRISGHATLERLASIVRKLLPATLVPNSYFIYFCLGYVIRRLIPQLSDRSKKRLICFGLICWLADTLFAHFGIDRVDPSYFWMSATMGVFLLFDGLKVPSRTFTRCVGWTAKRSYSIYLLQYTTIAISAPFVYDVLFGGIVPEFAAAFRIAAWVLMLLLAYGIALLVASIVDAFLLRPFQVGFGRLSLVLQRGISFLAEER